MVRILTFIGFILLSSCVPQAPRGTRKTTSANATNMAGTPAPTASSSGSGTNTATSTDLYWYSGLSVPGTITINQDTSTVLYLRGKYVDNFLKVTANFNKVYCLVVRLNDPLAKTQLRARAVPISFSNLSAAGTQERLLRIDLPSVTENQSFCAGTVDGVTIADVAYTPLLSCTTCFNIIPSSSVKLYSSTGAGLNLVDINFIPRATLDLSSLGLRINPESNSGTGQELCSAASCGAKGYDCCLDGQCVKDGGLRPTASSDTQYTQAINDVAINSMNFINWPNIYYVCSNMLRPTPAPTAAADIIATSNALFENQKKEYYCLEEGKKTSPDYAVGYCSNSAYLTVLSCTTAGATWVYYCGPSGTLSNYLAIREDVWTRCGCEASPFPTPAAGASTDIRCPDYGLKAVTTATGTITQILCDNPLPKIDPTPFQNLTVKVSGRTAPHRFYKSSDYSAVDDITLPAVKLATPAITQEGTEFKYQNEAGKTEPQEVANNMNALLGTMKIDLSKAQPAKMVALQVDQTYIIQTTTGIYTPCPMCAKDSWFEAFSAFPPSEKGKGLMAAGHIAKKDNYVTNTTMGNYEDTLFGRACFLPPTMIPFSHYPNATLATQRQNRLKTQYLLYANGYQRDWFGFNRGALIGSFDGVRWFAVGTGRRIRATSNKLFLAINAPFADLADFTTFNVSVVLDQGDNIAADFDYDTGIDKNDARQNSAGTCQNYHQCSTDSDCITQLGWEYMCNDISKYKTNWPKFDIDGTELVNQGLEGVPPASILGELPSGSNKRCVYRGAGAPCLLDPTLITAISTSTMAAADKAYDSRAKMLTCAPNFYCAQLSEAAYNTSIVRTPNDVYGIFFGQEANFLGRPDKYVGATGSLDSAAQTSILNNINKATGTTFTATSAGVCRPGKYLGSSTYYAQMAAKDNSKRTDVFGQVGSCDSTTTTAPTFTTRARTCPAFGTTDPKDTKRFNNLIFYDSTSTKNDSSVNLRKSQNACGLEGTTASDATPASTSPFSKLELSVSALNTVSMPSLAANACYRRAGSPCFTDYDCSPNELHANEAEMYGASYFGFTYAERKYWQEYLVCGQADGAPVQTSALYKTYDLKQNRCCREINKGFTMYTEVNDTTLVNSKYLEKLTPPTAPIVATPADSSPDTDSFPGDYITTQNRYSRYALLGGFTSPTYGTPTYSQPIVTSGSTPSYYQWKSINQTGKQNCCGGGFIRKFADGSNDWSKRDRFKYDVRNFQCLNFENDLVRILGSAFQWPSTMSPLPYQVSDYLSGSGALSRAQTEYDNFCLYPTQDPSKAGSIGCLEIPITDAKNFQILPPSELASATDVTLSTVPTNMPITETNNEVKNLGNLLPTVPYLPIPFAPGLAGTETPGGLSVTDSLGKTLLLTPLHHSLEFYLPVYIEFNNIAASGVTIEYYNGTEKAIKGTYVVPPLAAPPALIAGLCPDMSAWRRDRHTSMPHGFYCYDQTTRKIYLSTPDCNAGSTYNLIPTSAANTVTGIATCAPAVVWTHAGVKITFRPHGRGKIATGSAQPATAFNLVAGHNTAIKAGNTLYYLTKLGRLELLGIPQIFYEPLYCTSQRDVLLPNLFSATQDGSDTLLSRTQFQGDGTILNPGVAFTNTDYSGSTLERIYNRDMPTANDDAVGNTNDKVVFQKNIKHPAIFSPHEFKCCKKLGKEVTSSEQCCSGFTISANNKMYCRLPAATNLNVYFNRFVSSEGVGEDEPNGGLLDSDFIPETGEPKLSAKVYDKLTALGAQYCSNGAPILGGLVGDYNPQPNNGFYQSPVATSKSFADSANDINTTQRSGAAYYNDGFRWNHHLYCPPRSQ